MHTLYVETVYYCYLATSTKRSGKKQIVAVGSDVVNVSPTRGEISSPTSRPQFADQPLNPAACSARGRHGG